MERNEIIENARRIAAGSTIGEADFISTFEGLDGEELEEARAVITAAGYSFVAETAEDRAVLAGADLDTGDYFSCSEFAPLFALSNEELCVRAREGDEYAKAVLIEKNRRFVYGIAYRKARNLPAAGMDVADLYQEGVIGLLTAIDKFDITRGYSFLTYAGWWVAQKMTRASIDNGYEIRLPVHLYDRIVAAAKSSRANNGLTGSELLSAVAADCGIDDEAKAAEYIALAENILHTSSLNETVGEDGDTERQDLIADTRGCSVEDEVMGIMMREDVNRALASFPDKEADIIRRRFGLDGYEEQTLEEIGDAWGLTRERIRQIVNRVLRQLRHPAMSGALREYAA